MVRNLTGSGGLRPVVVVGLGTNSIVTTSELHQAMHLLGPHRKLVLINTYVQEPWGKEVNGTMAAFTRQHPNVMLADWFDTIKDRTYLLWPDKIHPQLPGTKVYARMVDRAVQETCGVPSSASPAAAPANAAGPPHTPGPRQSRLAIRDRLQGAAGPAGRGGAGRQRCWWRPHPVIAAGIADMLVTRVQPLARASTRWEALSPQNDSLAADLASPRPQIDPGLRTAAVHQALQIVITALS